nr:hypothetical protein [Tanacetum cinerariifolium]
PGCLFVVGVSGGGSGIGVRVVEWQENGESGVVESCTGICHVKPYTLRGGPSMKLRQRSDSQTHVLHLYWDLPAKIEIMVIQGLETQHPQEELFDLIEA